MTRAIIDGTAKCKLSNDSIEQITGTFECNVALTSDGELNEIIDVNKVLYFEPTRDVEDWNDWQIDEVIEIEDIEEYELQKENFKCD